MSTVKTKLGPFEVSAFHKDGTLRGTVTVSLDVAALLKYDNGRVLLNKTAERRLFHGAIVMRVQGTPHLDVTARPPITDEDVPF